MEPNLLSVVDELEFCFDENSNLRSSYLATFFGCGLKYPSGYGKTNAILNFLTLQTASFEDQAEYRKYPIANIGYVSADPYFRVEDF